MGCGASKGQYLDLRLGANTRSCRGLDRRRQYRPSCRPALGHSSVACCARKRNAVDLLVASSINDRRTTPRDMMDPDSLGGWRFSSIALNKQTKLGDTPICAPAGMRRQPAVFI